MLATLGTAVALVSNACVVANLISTSVPLNFGKHFHLASGLSKLTRTLALSRDREATL
jgi:hypothetical protein